MPEYLQVDERLQHFVEAQKMFFVATAAPCGRVNLAPKGMDTLRLVATNRIVWLNLTGAENETAAHLLESSRMTSMWCSFDHKPMILRVYGEATIIHPRDDSWDDLAGLFPRIPGARQILDLEVNFVLTSCGFGVPLYEFVGHRDTLHRWAESKGEEGLNHVWRNYNNVSLDRKPTGI